MNRLPTYLVFFGYLCAQVFVLLSVTGCGGAYPGEDASGLTSAENLAPPSNLHWVDFGSHVRLVFDRSQDDTASDSPVDHYLVCVNSTSCAATTSNHLDFPAGDPVAVGDEAVTVHAVGADDEHVGPASESSLFGTNFTVIYGETLLGSEAYGKIGAPLSTNSAPSKVYAPVYGSFSELGSSTGSNKTSKAWGAWQHKSGAHKTYGGLNASNDNYAWDLNLNLKFNIGSDGANLDKKADFMPVGYGTVTTWAGKNPGTDYNKSILIDHGGWFSGYLHAYKVYVKKGDYVTPRTRIGRIGNSGNTNNYHLHFAVYNGENKYNGLKSVDVSFITHSIKVSFTSVGTLAVGAVKKLKATAKPKHATGVSASSVDLNSSAVYDGTLWASSNKGVVSVNGNGVLTAKAKGSAVITLYYSGTKSTYTVTVGTTASSSSSSGNQWDWAKCKKQICAEGYGDCDSDSQCAGSLICGKDNAQQFNPAFPSNGDICVKKPSSSSSSSSSAKWDWSLCKKQKCTAGMGDCDKGQCAPGYKCKYNVAKNYNPQWPSAGDICVKK